MTIIVNWYYINETGLNRIHEQAYKITGIKFCDASHMG